MAANGEDLTEGPLSKWTNKLSGWQYRWFVLDSKGGYMSYYTVRNRPVHPTPFRGENGLSDGSLLRAFRLWAGGVRRIVSDLVKYRQFALC